MSYEMQKIEKTAGFKLFLRRIGFKSYDEYLELFGQDLEKRKTAVKRYAETYKLNLSLNELLKCKK